METKLCIAKQLSEKKNNNNNCNTNKYYKCI